MAPSCTRLSAAGDQAPFCSRASRRCPTREGTAARGRWVAGPGEDFLEVVKRELRDPPLIAEDLGVVTPEVVALRDRFALPGIKVLQFGFGDAAEHLPHNHGRCALVTTGTHDNDTSAGWLSSATRRERAFALRYVDAAGPDDFPWACVRSVLASVGQTAIVPVQDLLGLGSEARINRPGTSRGNWRWRLREEALTASLGERLLGLTELYGRAP